MSGRPYLYPGLVDAAFDIPAVIEDHQQAWTQCRIDVVEPAALAEHQREVDLVALAATGGGGRPLGRPGAPVVEDAAAVHGPARRS
jgi:hypothetical protein